MDEGTGVPRRRRGRPRDPQVEESILRAAIAEYIERGLAGLSMEGVARRADVGKSTVYLRWPDKDHLLADAVLARSRSIEAVDTGALRTDLIELAQNLHHYLLDPIGWATFRIAADAVGRGRRSQVDVIAQRHREAADAVLTRAIERGELDDPGRVRFLVECLYGAIVMKILNGTTDGSVTEVRAACVELVDRLLLGAARRDEGTVDDPSS